MNFIEYKTKKNKKVAKIVSRISLSMLVLVIMSAWIFTGLPTFYLLNKQFPPAIQEAKAAISMGTTATAVAFENASNPTISITPVAADDVCIFQAFVRGATAPTGITETTGSDTWTQASNPGTTNVWVGQWYLNNPTAEAKTIQLTVGTDYGFIEVFCLQGTNTTTPVNDTRSTSYTASSGEPSVTITTDYANSWIISVCGNQWSNVPTYGANQTEIWNAQIGGGSKTSGAGTREALATAGNDTQSCTFNRSKPNGIHSIEVREPAAGGITVSGGCFTDETEGTACTDDGADEIKVAINGVVDSGVDTTVDGAWSFTTASAPSTGDILTFFRNGEATASEEATTVVKYDGSGDVTLVKMYESQLVIGADSGSANSDQTITVADMDTTTNGYENSDDEDVLYDVTAGADLTVDADADKTDQLYIISGDTFRPASGGGSDTTTENLEIDASAVITSDSNNWTVSGNWNNNGTFTANTSTITFNAADTGNTIDGGASATYNNLTFIGSDGSGTWTMQNDDFTVTGTIDVDTSDILTIASGRTLTHTGATMTLDGDITGAGTLRFTDASGGPGAGAGTLSSIVRYDATAGNIASTTLDARTYSGRVEFFSSSTTARTATFATGTYTLSGASSHLYVIADGASPGDVTLIGATNNPTVAIGGDLDYTGTGSSSEIITSGTGTWTVSGHVDFTAGTYTATSGNTFQMNGTTKNITSNAQVFDNFSITGGSITTVDQMAASGNFNLTTGTLTQGANVDIVLTGDAVNLAASTTFTKASGTGTFIMDGVSDNQSFEDLNATKQDMGSVQIGQSPGTTKLKSDFSASSLTILTGDTFETHGWEVDISGAIDCQGTCNFNLTDNVPNNEGDGTIVTFGGNWTMSGTATFTPSTDSRVEPDGTADQTVTTGAKAFWDFFVNNAGATDTVDDVIISGTFDIDGALTINDGELDLEANDPTTDVEGNVTINTGGEFNATSTGTITFAGSLNNNDTFTANTSTVTFDSTDTGETIDAGAQTYNNVIFNNSGGGWTIQNDNMTVGVDLNLSAGSVFTLSSGLTLEVQGALTHAISGANTTFTGSTLYLNGSGGTYEINTKTHGGDVFATLRVGASEDIAMWDSSATTFTIDAGACLYSQDHGTTAGQLNIYGDCSARTNEYWSYAKDFDGAAVTRQSDVRFAPSATFTVDSADTLEITGQSPSTNRTIITRQSTGNYGMTVDGTIDAQYYDFDYMNDSGLNITSNAVITELSDGSFDNNAAGAASAYITIAGITSQKNFFNNTFDDSGDGTDVDVDYNVNADGSGIDWTFFSWDGNKGGEDFDNELNGSFVGWNAELTMSVDDNIMDLGLLNPLVVGSDSHNITVTSNAINGYTCRAVEDGELRRSTDDIDQISDGTVTAGAEEYGISCSGADCQLTGDNALSGTPLVVAQSSAPADATVTTVTYKAGIATSTVGGHYSHLVTFTCTADF